MNEYILESAAVYANAYKDSCAKRGVEFDARTQATLRAHITKKFGAVYAAILC